MKILSLEIHEIRGIRSQVLDFDGMSAVVFGPNGSGKSGVIDAVNFLLTGRIDRLSGDGTGSISLGRHGPHVDSEPEDAWVSATVEIAGEADVVELKRSVGNPRAVEVQTEHRELLEAELDRIASTHFVLTRRELLRFITVGGSDRAQQVEALLDLAPISRIRSALVRAANEAGKRVEDQRRARAAVEARIASHVGRGAFDESDTCGFVNEQRAILSGDAVDSLQSSGIRAGIGPPGQGAETLSVRLGQAAKASRSVAEALEQAATAVEVGTTRLQELQSLVAGGGALDPQESELIRLGLDLVVGDQCPLCGVDWDQAVLAADLERRLDEAAVVSEALQASRAAFNEASNAASVVAEGASLLAEQEGLQIESGETERDWGAIRETASGLVDDLRFPDLSVLGDWVAPDLADLLGALPVDTALSIAGELESRYQVALDAEPGGVTAQQGAWEALTRIEEDLSIREEATRKVRLAQIAANQAEAVREAFIEARDDVLSGVYLAVAERFADLYKALHTEEADFSAVLQPSGAALDLTVGFHGRGLHVPHALHSEGHQDSMGLCLFLALAEQLAGGQPDLLLLDDVMMSVDAGHRRSLASLLSLEFPSIQMIITTHDHQWAKQLQRAGVVVGKQMVRFLDWDIDAGPMLGGHTAVPERVQELLSEGDTHAAAHAVRRGAEEVFFDLCDRLDAPVPFEASGQYEAGVLVPAAVGHLKRLFKKGKAAANSFGNADLVAQLSGLEEGLTAAAAAFQSEQWVINPAVHFNVWENLTADEVVPASEALMGLIAVFACPQCEGFLRLLYAEGNPNQVACACGNYNFGLESRG